MITAAPLPWNEARRRLRRAIRRRTDPANAWAAGRRKPDARLVSAPFGDWHHQLAYVDHPDFVRWVNEADLRRWDVTPAQLWESSAYWELQPITDAPWKGLEGPDAASYAAILHPEEPWLRAVEPPVILALPDADSLWLAHGGDASTVSTFLAAVRDRHANAGKPVSRALFPIGDRAALTEDVAMLVHTAALEDQQAAYAAESQLLLEDDALDGLRIGAFGLIRTGELARSFTVCEPGVPTLLPFVEWVQVGDPARPLKDGPLLTWIDFLQLAAGQVLQRPELPLPRFEARVFSSFD